MFTESYHKASADFKAWLDYHYCRDLSPLTRGIIASEHATLMEAVLSQNAEIASTLKEAQLEIKTLRDRLDDAERRAHRAESDLGIFQGSVDASHRFLNEYLGTPESHDHGPVTSRIKTLLEAKDELLATRDDRIVELEAKVAKLDADTAIDFQVYALSQADKMRIRMLEHALRNVDELLTKHGVSRDGYVTQKIERLIADKDAAIADREAKRVEAQATIDQCKGFLRCFITSEGVDMSDLGSMVLHLKSIVIKTHTAIDAAGEQLTHLFGTERFQGPGLPEERIGKLAEQIGVEIKRLQEASSEGPSVLQSRSAAWAAVVAQIGRHCEWSSLPGDTGQEKVVNEIARLQKAAAAPRTIINYDCSRNVWPDMNLECRLENQKRETAKWKRAARAHASGLASIKRVLDSIAPIGSPAISGFPASAALVDRIRGLEKHGIKTLAARERFIEMLKGSIEEAHAVLDKSKFLTPRSTSHRPLGERIGSLVSWSNLYVSK